MEYDAAPYQKEVRRQVTNLSAGFFSQNIYEGKMKKCVSLLAVSSYQGVFKNLRGQILNMYEIQKYYVYNLFTKKSRMAYWQTGTVGLYCNQNELALYAREC